MSLDEKMLMFLLLLGTLMSRACADCEACVDGHCFSRKTLIHGFHVSDRLAIDHVNNVLYVQLNSNLNTAFYLDDLQIHLIQTRDTTDMAFDPNKKVLYTAGPNKELYKYKPESDTTEIVLDNPGTKVADRIFYEDTLYYTTKTDKGLFLNQGGVERFFTYLVNFNITDFVLTKDKYIYFIADGNVYLSKTTWFSLPELVTQQKCSLSIDKNDNVYFGDAETNVIYKIKELKEFEEYAAYKTGWIDGFVFDNDNNVVFHDKRSGDVVAWKPQFTNCSIHAPHSKYSINVDPDDEN